jgi:tetratricopeptide (TPR) repeat protein/predicted Ser/Thr protein kinase
MSELREAVGRRRAPGNLPECLIKAGFGTASGTEGGGNAGFVPPPVEAMAKLFPQLEVLELIGRGGMGAVYKARQPGLDRLVALKILPPRTGSDPGFAERFTREARALAKLNHPNIVGVYDFGQVSSASVSPAPSAGAAPPSTLNPQPSTTLHYFLMEYVDGPNLRQLERAGKLSPREAMQIIPQICEALQYAHDEGIVHRDIKPENVLLDKKGRVKIADFGLAKILGREPQDFRLTGAGQVMGTPNYMAPEQIEHPQAVDHRADIYSLGVVFYEMLTGELPLRKFAPPASRTQGMQIDVRLDEVVLHALEKEPERRYQHASQVKSDVETITAQPDRATPLVVPAATAAPVAAEERIQTQVKWPALGLAVAAGFGCLSFPVFLAMAPLSLAAMERSGLIFSTPARVALQVTPVIMWGLVIYAALKMMRLEARGAALAASLIAMLVYPGNIVGFPIGIWSLIVLTRPEVRDVFQKRRAALAAANAGRSARTPLWFWLLAAAPILAILVFQLGRSSSIIGGASVPSDKVRGYDGITARLEALRNQEQELLTQYPSGDPKVQETRRQIDGWKRLKEDLDREFPSLGHRDSSSGGVTEAGGSASQLTQEGWQLWQARQLDEAAAKFNQAVKLDPKKAEAWNGLGWASFNSGKWPEAEKAFQATLALDGNHPAALNGLGQLYLAQKKNDLAETYLLKAAPRAPAAWYGLARLYLLQGKFDEAEKWASKVVDSGQGDDVASKMLEAAKAKHLPEGLRLVLEPP